MSPAEVAAARRSLGLSQTAMAEAMGISLRTMQSLEWGDAHTKMTTRHEHSIRGLLAMARVKELEAML